MKKIVQALTHTTPMTFPRGETVCPTGDPLEKFSENQIQVARDLNIIEKPQKRQDKGKESYTCRELLGYDRLQSPTEN